jgi:hypothetical protein
MKKLLTLAIIVATLSSCKKEEPKDCKCGVIYKVNNFHAYYPNDYGNRFEIFVKNDCTENTLFLDITDRVSQTMPQKYDYLEGKPFCHTEEW